MIMAIRFIEIQKKECLWKKWDKSLADMMDKGTRGAWAPVSLHRPDISTMAEEVFNNYHSIPAF